MNRMWKFVGVAAVAMVGLTACGDDEKKSDTKATDTKTTAVTDGTGSKSTEASAATITVDKAWARNSPAMATAGAAYMNLTASADDKLVKASVDATVAQSVEIHETVMAESTAGTGMTKGTMMDKTKGTGSDATHGTGMSGAMTMKPVESITLPKGVMVELKPGGYHIMMLKLAKPLKVGDTVKITLTFDKAGTLVVDVPVREDAP